jgi:hypothetical protein
MAHARLTRTEVIRWPSNPNRCRAVLLTTRVFESQPRQLDAWSHAWLSVAAISTDEMLSVTLCGPVERVEAWVAAHKDTSTLHPPHPWHHPMYLDVPSIRDGSKFKSLPVCDASGSREVAFMSATTQHVGRPLDVAHWREWHTTPVYFKGSLERGAPLLAVSAYLIKTGAHPVLTAVATETLHACSVGGVVSAASMRRGQPAVFWRSQRSILESAFASPGSHSYGPMPMVSPDAVAEQIRHLLANSFHVDQVGFDAPLMDCSLESFDFPCFADAVNAAFDTHLPPALVLECGTVRAIATQLLGTCRPLATTIPRLVEAQLDIALCSGNGRWPVTPGVSQLVSLTNAGGAAILEVLALRWSSSDAATRHGGFVSGAQRFDHRMFSAPPAKGRSMDPQQRLLLESGYEAAQVIACMGVPSPTAPWRAAVALLKCAATAAPSEGGSRFVLAIVQRLAVGADSPRAAVVLTRGGLVSNGAASGVSHGGAWGFAHMVRLEHPALVTASVGVSSARAARMTCRLTLALGMVGEPEACWMSEGLFVSRLRACSTPLRATASARTAAAHGVYAITGGLSGPGLRAATLLVEDGATGIVLSSRSGGKVSDGPPLDVQSSTPLRLVASDVSDAALSLVIHSPLAVAAAAAVSRGTNKALTIRWLRGGGAPGSVAIRRATTNDISSLVMLEASRQQQQGWLLAASERTIRQRIQAHPIGQFVAVAPDGQVVGTAYTQRVVSHQSLLATTRERELTLHTPHGRVVQLLGVVQMPAANVSEQLRRYVLHCSGLDANVDQVCVVARCRSFNPSVHGASRATYQAHVDTGTDPELMLHTSAGACICGLVAGYRAADAVNLGYGVIVTYDLRSAGAGAGRHLAPTPVHSAAQACRELKFARSPPGPVQRLPSEQVEDEQQGWSHHWQSRGQQHLVAASARWPGSATTSFAFLPAGGNAVGQIPSQRWDVADSPVPAGRFGAFLLHAERFAAAFFGVSAAETSATDPQQRLLLEHGYAALHSTHERRESLRAADVGVSLGIMNADFASIYVESGSVYAATGGTISIAAGRLSFVLGTQGPVVSYDTACSSGLVASHAAFGAARAGECVSSLVLAVSLMLSPQVRSFSPLSCHGASQRLASSASTKRAHKSLISVRFLCLCLPCELDLVVRADA